MIKHICSDTTVILFDTVQHCLSYMFIMLVLRHWLRLFVLAWSGGSESLFYPVVRTGDY
jgi:hypothetical protein